eukprot:COSAG02_NODE_4004_length_5925_cov_3.094233_4_plen_63_part_00
MGTQQINIAAKMACVWLVVSMNVLHPNIMQPLNHGNACDVDQDAFMTDWIPLIPAQQNAGHE